MSIVVRQIGRCLVSSSLVAAESSPFVAEISVIGKTGSLSVAVGGLSDDECQQYRQATDIIDKVMCKAQLSTHPDGNWMLKVQVKLLTVWLFGGRKVDGKQYISVNKGGEETFRYTEKTY